MGAARGRIPAVLTGSLGLVNRRTFLRSTGVGVLALPLQGALDPWSQVASILSRIRPPRFLARRFDVTRHGAKGDGKTDCAQAGGGRVVVPAGEFLTGAIRLRSNVDLHVSEGATLRLSQDPRHHLPAVFTRWEGVECMNYSAFIYAYGEENVAVTGRGTLDGQADNQHWWPWCGNVAFGSQKGDPAQQKARAALFDMGEKDVPVRQRVLGEGTSLRPIFLPLDQRRGAVREGHQPRAEQ